MSAGKITSPSSWSIGTVAPPTWFQNVQDTINQQLQNPAAWQTGNSTFVVGAAAGITGSVIAPGSCKDCAGGLQVTPGGSSIGAGTLVTITFQNTSLYDTTTYGNGPTILLTPANAAAAALSGSTQVYATSTFSGSYWNGWLLKAGGALTSGTSYLWNYFVIVS